MELKNCFNEQGYLLIDPYRQPDNDDKYYEIYNTIFDKNGNVKLNILDEINSLHHKMKWGIAADTVKILYAYDIPDFTKNNYSSIYAWR